MDDEVNREATTRSMGIADGEGGGYERRSGKERGDGAADGYGGDWGGGWIGFVWSRSSSDRPIVMDGQERSTKAGPAE
jgi:hypothetical protein